MSLMDWTLFCPDSDNDCAVQFNAQAGNHEDRFLPPPHCKPVWVFAEHIATSKRLSCFEHSC